MEEYVYACPFRDRDIVRLSKTRIFIVLSGGECELDGLSNLCIPISTKYHQREFIMRRARYLKEYVPKRNLILKNLSRTKYLYTRFGTKKNIYLIANPV